MVLYNNANNWFLLAKKIKKIYFDEYCYKKEVILCEKADLDLNFYIDII